MAELAAWRDFYISLQGWNWLNCANSYRYGPCTPGLSCNLDGFAQRHVKCDVVGRGDTYAITEIYLPNSNVKGLVPEDALVTFSNLRVLELSTTPGASLASSNVLFNGPCVTVPNCISNKAVCRAVNTGLQFCNATNAVPGTSSPSVSHPPVTRSPTPFPSNKPTTRSPVWWGRR